METITLLRKVFITGKIRVKTGLHIGGAKAAVDIGGLDLAVVKAGDQKPYIPGSSFRGKLRGLNARTIGSVAVAGFEVKDKRALTDDSGKPETKQIARIFGLPGKRTVPAGDQVIHATRLIVRDAHFDKFAPDSGVDQDFLDYEWTETKWENRIDRRTGTAKDPRQLERVPAGALFDFEMVYDSYGDGHEQEDIACIIAMMKMLEDDYLGGHGSRGYGRIQFSKVEFSARTVEDYIQGNPRKRISDYTWTLSS